MPGPGTSDHTKKSVQLLAKSSDFDLTEVPIDAAVKQHLDDVGHDGTADVTFENSQARERTQILFDTANKVGAIVVGTGDLSELALGWCTFNADHMSNYNVNVSVPKTMIAYLVRWYAQHRASVALNKVLQRVIDTPLAESSICGVAIGAAVNGMRPIAEIQFADFVWPAINQIVGEASKIRYGTFGKKKCPITIRIPYGGGVRGRLYHSQSIEVLFAHTPGLKVIAPATPYDTAGLL